MRVSVDVEQGVVVVSPKGEVNFENTSMVAQAIREHLDTSRHFLIELSEVPFMDSTSVGTVLDALRMVRARDGDLRLAGLVDNVARVFELMDARRILRIYETAEEALTSFKEGVKAPEPVS